MIHCTKKKEIQYILVSIEEYERRTYKRIMKCEEEIKVVNKCMYNVKKEKKKLSLRWIK